MTKRYFLLILMLLIISGCSGEKCIDPDDFGFPSFTVSARYKEEELEGDPENQIAPWRDYGLRTNGRPITIVVRNWDHGVNQNNAGELSAWSSWFGTKDNTNTLPDIVLRMRDCEFQNNDMCPSNGNEMVILNPPCLFKKGIGLYTLIAKPGTDPNSSRENKLNPEGIAFHVGVQQIGYDLYSSNKEGILEKVGGTVFNYEVPNSASAQSLKEEYYQAPLYFKIVDKIYSDNSGQYKITIKSGVGNTHGDPLEFLTSLVKKTLYGSDTSEGVIKSIYQNITGQTAYKIFVRALLILYVMFSAFGFLIGSIRITNAELLSRIFKVVIVSILLTSDFSWSFFNDYLFVYFLGGVDYITQIISDSVSGGGFGKLPLLQIMIAPQIFIKMFSLLFVSYFGWAFIIIYLILLFFVLTIIIKATILYLTAIIIIGLLIILGPIFITFLLFEITKSLFDNWLKQLISYAIQPIILFTGMGMMAFLIQQEIYATLGFKVCKQEIFDFGPISYILGGFAEYFGMGSGSNSLFYFWFPSPRDPGSISTTTQMIPIPYDHVNSSGTFCKAYECNGLRIPDLPFLDPADPRDSERINNFISGNYFDFKNMLMLFVAIYVLNKFNSISVSIGQFLSSTSGNLSNLGGTVESVYTPVASYVGGLVKNRLVNPAWRAIKNSPLGAPVRLADKLTTAGLTKAMEALYNKELESSFFMADSVRKLAEEKSGIKYDSLNMKDYKLYKNTLYDLFKEAGVKGFSASKLARMSVADIEKELALGKFGKDLTALSDKEQQQLKALIGGAEKKLGHSLKEAKLALKDIETFQKAYMEAHMEMSKKGIGFFSKRSTLINNIENLRQKYKEFKGRKEKDLKRRVEKTEKYYKMYDELLNQISGGRLGGEFNYYDYQNSRMLTYGEEVIERELKRNSDSLENEINRKTVQTGRDVLRPEFLAELELTSHSDVVESYKELVNEHISKSVYESMTTDYGDGPVLMGRRYMSERMSDKEFKEAIDKAYAIKDKLINEDAYLQDKGTYLANLRAREKEVNDDLSLIDDPKLAEQLMDKLEHDNITTEDIETLMGDKKYDTLRTKIQDYQFNKAVLQRMQEREEAIANEVGVYINEMNKFRTKAEMEEYKPFSLEENELLQSDKDKSK